MKENTATTTWEFGDALIGKGSICTRTLHVIGHRRVRILVANSWEDGRCYCLFRAHCFPELRRTSCTHWPTNVQTRDMHASSDTRTRLWVGKCHVGFGRMSVAKCGLRKQRRTNWGPCWRQWLCRFEWVDVSVPLSHDLIVLLYGSSKVLVASLELRFEWVIVSVSLSNDAIVFLHRSSNVAFDPSQLAVRLGFDDFQICCLIQP